MEVAAYRQPSMLTRKRASAGCAAFGVKEDAIAVGNMPDADRAREVVRQRFQAELVAVRRLLEKAAAVPVPVPVPRSESKEPPAKRSKKASTSPAPAVARKMMAVEEEEEDVDIVGGVSPVVIAPALLQLAQDEDMDICGEPSPVVMPNNLGDVDATISGGPSSSSSDSDGDGSVVDSPAPAERDGTPPTIAELIARAKESLERQRKEARSRAREKARQEVLQTERTATPDDETIHPTVLESLHVADQYNRGNLLRRLGLFLKADDYGIEEQQQDHRRQSFQEDEDLEEGEIRV